MQGDQVLLGLLQQPADLRRDRLEAGEDLAARFPAGVRSGSPCEMICRMPTPGGITNPVVPAYRVAVVQSESESLHNPTRDIGTMLGDRRARSVALPALH